MKKIINYLKLLIISISLLVSSGCVVPLHISYDKPIVKPIKHHRLKDSKQTIIRAIMIEGDMPEPEATILWEGYKTSNLRDFSEYLIAICPYQVSDSQIINAVERMKIRTKILKRRKYEK